MQTILLAVSFALAAAADAPQGPQQPLQAELGIASRQGKIDFKLAAVRRPADGAFVDRPDVGKSDAAAGSDDAPIAVAKPRLGSVDAAAAARTDVARAAIDGVDAARPQPAKAIPAVGCPGGVPIPAASKVDGAPALLVASLSPRLAHFVAQLPPLLADGVVVQVGALDADGSAVVSRYAADFPAGVRLHAQAVLLVDGRILASDVRSFTGSGSRSGG